jgi:hypothetical protein
MCEGRGGGELKTQQVFWFIDRVLAGFLFKIQILNKNDKPTSFLVYH